MHWNSLPSNKPTLITVGVTDTGEPFQLNLDEAPHTILSTLNDGNRILHTIQGFLEHEPGWAILALNIDTIPNLAIANQVMDSLGEACEERGSNHQPRILLVMENADDLLITKGDEDDQARRNMVATIRNMGTKAHEAGIYMLLSFTWPDVTILNAGFRPYFHNLITIGHHGQTPSAIFTETDAPYKLPEDDTTTGVAVINQTVHHFTPNQPDSENQKQ